MMGCELKRNGKRGVRPVIIGRRIIKHVISNKSLLPTAYVAIAPAAAAEFKRSAEPI